MSERIQPSFSLRVRLGEEEVLINRIYDHAHVFSWLGHGILKIVNEEGFLQWHTTQEAAEEIASKAGITPIYRTEITPEEQEQYLQYQQQFLGDSWL